MAMMRQEFSDVDKPGQASPRIGAVPWGIWLLVALLLAVFAAQNVLEMRQESCSSDEVIHLPAGYTYLLKRDFRFNPEHPPLLKELCALPLLWLHPKIDFNDPNWADEPNQQLFGYHFLYSNNADQLLFWGRMPIVILGVLLGFFVFRWGQQLYGSASGIFALVLYSFSPNIIAHSHLVTTDLGVTTFLTMTFYFLWRYLRREKRRNLIWAALAMGAALASKFSAVAIFPVALFILWMFHQGRDSEDDSIVHPRGGRRKKGVKTKLSDWNRRRRKLGPVAGFFRELFSINRRKLIEIAVFAGIALVIVQLTFLGSLNPLLYIKGMDRVNANHNPWVPSFLHGNLKAGGWWFYFIVAFLVKASAPLILLMGIRFFLFFKNRMFDWKEATFLVLPSAIMFWAISAMADPLGVRYVLPVFPLMMIFSSGALKLIPKNKWLHGGLWCLLGWHVVSSVSSFPYSMSYFSDFVGGPSHGRFWLDDSNVDWGQNLKRLKTLLDEKGIKDIVLWPFSRYDNPEYYGIKAYRPTGEEWVKIAKSPSPPPGVYVISEHWLVRLKALGGDWMNQYPLIGRVGYSMFVFRIP